MGRQEKQDPQKKGPAIEKANGDKFWYKKGKLKKQDVREGHTIYRQVYKYERAYATFDEDSEYLYLEIKHDEPLERSNFKGDDESRWIP